MAKRIVSGLFVLLLISALCLSAFAVAEPSEQFYVADYADVLSPELEKQICDFNGALEQQCQGAQFVVLTVNYLDGMYSDEYASQVFAEWGIGSEEYNNGVLLLLAVQEKKYWLMGGYGIQNSFDPYVDDILDRSFEKDFDNGRYDKAVESVLEDVLQWFDSQYGAATAHADEYYEEAYSNSNEGYSNSVISPRIQGTIVKVVVVLIVLWLLFGRRRRGGGGYGGGGGGGFLTGLFLGNLFGRNRGSFGGYNGWGNRDGWNAPGGRGGGSWGGGGGRGGFGGGSHGGFGGGMGHGGGGFGGGGGGGRR